MKDKKNTLTDFNEAREHIHRQMLSAVSHDLKTPLATIIGSLEVYMRMDAKLSYEKKLMLIQSALQEAYRLDSFVTNMLDMAKLEQGVVKIKKEEIDLVMLLQDCVTRIGPKVERSNIKIRPEKTGLIVHSDPMLLGKAVGIVLDNALKYAPGLPPILMEYGILNDDAYIRITDNGPGIPSGKMEEIFSKYTRLSKNDQHNAGTGLGLAICRQIMSLLSGSVKVENSPQGGAMFTLTFAYK